MMFLYRSYFLKFINYFYISLIIIFYLITTAQILLSEVSNREVLISSENAKFDQHLGIISLDENVVLKIDNLTFKSDKMDLFFEDNSNFTGNFSNLKKIVASGNVLFERDQDIIKSDLIYFFPEEDKVKITGNVKVLKGKNIGFRSEILEINLKKDTSLN